MAVLITSVEVCELLGINLNNLYQLLHRKQITVVKKEAKRSYYDLAEVQALKAKRDARLK